MGKCVRKTGKHIAGIHLLSMFIRDYEELRAFLTKNITRKIALQYLHGILAVLLRNSQACLQVAKTTFNKLLQNFKILYLGEFSTTNCLPDSFR